MKKIRVFFDRPTEYKYRLDNFVFIDYSEPLLLFKNSRTFRIVLFTGIISRKSSKRFCLGYFNEDNDYDYLSVSMEEKNAYENLKKALSFISANLKVIKTLDLIYAYRYIKGEIDFNNGMFDFSGRDMTRESRIKRKVPEKGKTSFKDKAYRVYRVYRLKLHSKWSNAKNK